MVHSKFKKVVLKDYLGKIAQQIASLTSVYNVKIIVTLKGIKKENITVSKYNSK